MKIAILSDIHGNYAALSAILNSRDFASVEHLFILGDMVGYYYEPDCVWQAINQFSFDMVIGNHELFLTADETTLNEVRHKYGHGIDIALLKLSAKQRDYLTQLPHQKMVTIDNTRALLCHGSPWSVDEYIYPDADLPTLQSLTDYALKQGNNFLFMGHTHYPFIYHHLGCTLSNPGSVGQARDRGGLACWQLLDTITNVLIQKRTPYNTQSVKQSVLENDPTKDYLIRILERE